MYVVGSRKLATYIRADVYTCDMSMVVSAAFLLLRPRSRVVILIHRKHLCMDLTWSQNHGVIRQSTRRTHSIDVAHDHGGVFASIWVDATVEDRTSSPEIVGCAAFVFQNHNLH